MPNAAKPWDCTLQTKPEFLAVREQLEQLLVSPWGAPMWGRAGWLAAPSAVGLKQMCTGSLLCKGGLPLGCSRAGDTPMGGGLVRIQPPPYPFPAPALPRLGFLPPNTVLALAAKTHQRSSCVQQPKPLPCPEVTMSHSWPHPANHGDPLLAALSHATGYGTPRCLGERLGVKSHQKMLIFMFSRQVRRCF